MPHLDEAYSLARWLTGSAADAEDVVQESLMKAFKHFAGFRGPEARAWLLTIVRRTSFTWLAINRPRQLVLTDDEAAVEVQNRATVVTLHPKAAETPESLLKSSARLMPPAIGKNACSRCTAAACRQAESFPGASRPLG